MFVRAAAVQALLVAALFAILVALPLGDDFFEDYGWISGPVAWILCSAGTGWILALPVPLVLIAAAAGGVVGAVVGIGVSHTLGLVVGVAVFAAACAGFDETHEPARPRSSE